MNEDEYRRTVIRMRAAADAWYRLHKQSALIEAKRLEKIIDMENRRWLDEQASTAATAKEQRQLRLHLEDERDAGEPERYDGDLLLHG